jgi:hypothetical protein
MSQLGKLVKVDLRKVWEHEARDFSSWLVQQENLDALGEQLGIEIEPLGTEVESGRFRIDILAKEPTTDERIIIENQLEPTNHDHLGKVITYAAGYDARYLIWIVKEVLPEHLKAIEWLNEHLDDSIRCFLIRIEVWQIGDSKPAPRFEVVSVKNDWVSTLKQSAAKSELSALQLKQLDYWENYLDFSKRCDPTLKYYKPGSRQWLNFSINDPIAHIALTLQSQKNRLGAELYIERDKELLEFLKRREEEINNALNDEVIWFSANIASGLRVAKHVSNIFDKGSMESHFEWMLEKTVLLKKVLVPMIEQYKNEMEFSEE